MDIDKDDFPSEQANGDTEEDTALQLPPEAQTIAGASELTAPARMLSENRKEPSFPNRESLSAYPKTPCRRVSKTKIRLKSSSKRIRMAVFLFRFPSMELCSTPCRMFLSCCPIQMTRQPEHCSSVMKAARKSP